MVRFGAVMDSATRRTRISIGFTSTDILLHMGREIKKALEQFIAIPVNPH